MPTYQYACTVCGHRLEAVQSFSDAALVECPECAGRLRKLYSGVGIVFKGSGFYRTDSRASAKADAATGSGSAGSTEGAAAATKAADSSSTSPSTSSGSTSESAKGSAGSAGSATKSTGSKAASAA